MTSSPHACEGTAASLEDSRLPLVYVDKYREFVIVVDGPVFQVIAFCPWCGERLPTSLREVYFDRLERLGLDLESPDVPLDLRSGAWWRMENLT